MILRVIVIKYVHVNNIDGKCHDVGVFEYL